MSDQPAAGPRGPTRIGRYPVRRRLGAGAFATVWLGHDPEFEVDVAIKVLADNWSADPGIRDRFISEAKFLRRIRDRRVVHVYDIGTLADGRPYFVMDYLDAGSLEDLRRSRVPPTEALRLCAEAARGLDVLHRHHLVHRDVTPGNLLLSRRPDGSLAVVVADLGVARSVVDSSAGSMIVGTPSYMAPEQAAGGVVDHRADVYALCAVAYALLSGGPPFQVERLSDLTTRPADLEPPILAAALGAPAALDGIFVSGLATDPHRRPQSAALLADVFDQLAAEMQSGATAGSSGVRLGRPYSDSTPAALAPAAPVPAPAPPARLARPAPPAPPVKPAKAGRSSGFYIAMTVLAILLFTVFVAIVLGLSL